MKYHLLCFLSLIFLFSCSEKSHYITSSDTISQKRIGKPNTGCSQNSSYIPDTSRLELTPERVLKVNFHVMQRADGTGNFKDDEAIEYINTLMWVANHVLKEGNKKMNLPLGNDTPVLPQRYQYKITPDSSILNDDGIYFHKDDDFYFMVSKGKDRNLFSNAPFEKYGIQKGEVMNVFIMAYHKDSLASKTYKIEDIGVGFGHFVKMVGLKEANETNFGTEKEPFTRGAWYMQSLLNHEIGHSLGLSHTWGRDICDDTPSHSNCWNYSSGKCEKEVSNNIMDYNLFRNAWTPCQIGIVHRNMTLQNQRQRKMLVKDWCVLDENKSISISSNEDWNREVDLFGHLTIETGATLSVGCRVSLPKDARILIRPGGTLVLEEAAFLHNDCGELWDGIVVEREGKLKGIVKYYGKPRILDSKNPFEFPEL